MGRSHPVRLAQEGARQRHARRSALRAEVLAAGTTGQYQGAPETVEVVCAIAAKRGRQSTARWPGS